MKFMNDETLAWKIKYKRLSILIAKSEASRLGGCCYAKARLDVGKVEWGNHLPK